MLSGSLTHNATVDMRIIFTKEMLFMFPSFIKCQQSENSRAELIWFNYSLNESEPNQLRALFFSQ